MADWTNLLTGLLGAGASIYTANKQANAVQNAATQAAQQSQFRPVGITTRFGRSGFQYDPSTGQLVGAGYQVAPDVAAQREALLGLAGGQLSQAQQAQAMAPQVAQAAQGLFNLGQGYLAQTPQAAAQQFMAQQQQLLAPGREQQLSQAMNREYQRGTMGLGVGATQAGYQAGAPGLAASNPRLAALYNAQAAQDAQLAAQAQQAGMEQARFGQGLLGGALNLQGAGYGLQTQALSPYTGYFGAARTAETMGMQPIDISLGLAGPTTAAARAAAMTNLQAAQDVAALDARRNQAVIGGLSDPVAALIGALTKTPQPNFSTIGYTGPGRGDYF
jgi:hypothetical protein